jgi:glycosyltransferase domain-containing protein
MAAIIIPTKDRHDLLTPQLNYYAKVGCPHKIYIGDASDDNKRHAFQNILDRLSSSLDIEYFYVSPEQDQPETKRHAFLISKVKEEYVCYNADDDFQIPSAISRAEEFLRKNKDYSAAYGKAYLATVEKNEIQSLDEYMHCAFEAASAHARLEDFFKHYISVHTSVTKTAFYKEVFEKSAAMKDRSMNSEVIFGALTVIRGKVKLFDELSLFRQEHPRRSLVGSFFNWITSDFFSKDARTFVDIVSKDLARSDELELSDARKIVEKVFISYVARWVGQEFGTTTVVNESLKSILRRYKNRYFRKILGESFLKERVLKNLIHSHRELLNIIPFIEGELG